MRRLTCVALLAAVWLGGCQPTAEEIRINAVGQFQAGNVERAKTLLRQVLDRKPSDPEDALRMLKAVPSALSSKYYFCLRPDPLYLGLYAFLVKIQFYRLVSLPIAEI